MRRPADDPGPLGGSRGSHSFREGVALFGWLWVVCTAVAAVVAGAAALLSAGRWGLAFACFVAGTTALTFWGGPQAFKALRQWESKGQPNERGE